MIRLMQLTPEFRDQLQEALKDYGYTEPLPEFYAECAEEDAKLAEEYQRLEKLTEPTPEQLSKRFTI